MEQFIPNYEDKSIDQVATAVNSNLEFRVIKRPAEGVKAYMPHQIIFAREMTMQKRMICCHPMGSGKTCSIFFAAQIALQSNLVNHVLFVGPRTVLPQAREQFTSKCPSATKDMSRFTFMTFDKFLTAITGPDEKTFHGYLIIIDEAHNRLPNKYRAHYKINNPRVVGERDETRTERAEDWPKIKTSLASAAMCILATGTYVVNDLIEPIALADAISPINLVWTKYAHDVNGRKVFKDDGRDLFARDTTNFFSYIDPKTDMPEKRTDGERITVTNNSDGSKFTMMVVKVPMREGEWEGQYQSVNPACKFEVNHKTLALTDDCQMSLKLETVSPKHTKVLQLAQMEGVSVIYMEDVNNEGVFLYGALLKLMEYEWYEGKTDIVDFKPRFTIITGSTKPKQIEKILTTHNSPENWEGRLIKIVLITNAARDGISLFYAQRFIMAMSPWHIAGYDQAVARAVRADSHILWKLRRKSQLIGLGMSDERAQQEIDNFRVNVYNVVHFPNDVKDDDFNESRSERIPDLRRLTLCFQKKHYNADVVSLIHSNSIECKLLKHLDISYTRYKCISDVPWQEEANVQNYNSMFLEGDADLRIQELKSAGYMQPTRNQLLDMLTMEKILETSIAKRTPAGIQCFEDSDGQSAFSSYFYSMGFADTNDSVIWNDDFYCRNSTFVHDECRNPLIVVPDMSLCDYLNGLIRNIDNSGYISTTTEHFIRQDPVNHYNIVQAIFPAHVYKTSTGVIYHMFIPPNRERNASYFRTPYVTIYNQETKQWTHLVYSHGSVGSGMGRRTADYKSTYSKPENAWQVLNGSTRLSAINAEIADNVLQNVSMMEKLKDNGQTYAFVTDNNVLRVVFVSNTGPQNLSGKIIVQMSRAERRKVTSYLDLPVNATNNDIMIEFNRRHLLLVMQYDLPKLVEQFNTLCRK